MDRHGCRNTALTQTLAINSDYKRSLLESLDLFKGVLPEDVQHLFQRCDRCDIAQGRTLLSPGTRNEHVYIVLSGGLNVHISSPESPVLATMDAGACVGEMSIIEDRDPSAFVVAAEPTHLLKIHQSVLWDMVDASHEFAKNLLVVLSERVRSHNRVIADSYGELQKVERHARTDAITGLRNRHAMEESFMREITRCQKDEEPISLIMIDIDNFKVFNDQFGHVAGDRALSAVAGILRQSCDSSFDPGTCWCVTAATSSQYYCRAPGRIRLRLLPTAFASPCRGTPQIALIPLFKYQFRFRWVLRNSRPVAA